MIPHTKTLDLSCRPRPFPFHMSASSLTRQRLSMTAATWVGTVLLLLMTTNVLSSGIQSGPAMDNTFAGAMVYDSSTSHVYLSGLTNDASGWLFGEGSDGDGSTTQSHCFIAQVNVNAWNWNVGTTLAATSMCPAMTLLDKTLYNMKENLFVAGNSESGGFGYDATPSSGATGDEPLMMTAFGTLVERSTRTGSTVGSLVTTAVTPLSDSSRIEYPQFVISHARNIYSINLASLDIQENEDATQSGSSSNLLRQLPYGSSFDMTVRKLLLEQEEFLGIPSGSASMVTQWVKEFPLNMESSSTTSVGPRVYIGGALIMPNDDQQLLIVGSTRGSGPAYGSTVMTDEDGFMTVLDLQYGGIVRTERFGTDKPDVIMGVCEDPNDPSYVFLTGATQGTASTTIEDEGALKPPDGSLSGFVTRVSVDQLIPEWTRQWGARMPNNNGAVTGAFAVGCSVREGVLYVAGGVEKGAGIIQGKNILSSNGKDDIWAAALDTATGNQLWIQQIGTDGHDRLSRHGGVVASIHGSLMLYGDTTGSFFRTKTDDATDVFFMVLDSENGNFAPLGSPVPPPTQIPTPATSSPVALPSSPPVPFSPKASQLSDRIYTGAMTFDSRHNQAIITGQSVSGSDSKCFLSYFNMTTGLLSKPLRQRTRACSSIAYSPLEDTVYLGSTDKPTNFAATGNPNMVLLGLLMKIDLIADGAESSALTLLEDAISQYPVQVVVHPNQDVIFVAMDASDSSSSSGNADDGRNVPHFTNQRPYGSNFYCVVERYSLAADTNELVLDWTKQWRIDEASENVRTSDMVLAGNILIVVGSTRGTSANGPFGEASNAGDVDGFILKMDPISGELVGTNGHRSSTRLDSINHMDDWVLGVCTDVFDESAIYVVGKSQGKVRDLSDAEQPPEGTTHAFVAKVKIETLTAEWLQHFTMQANQDVLAQAAAYGCAVTTDNLVYVAGVIEDGAKMDDASVAPGAAKDDVFVVQLDGRSGEVNWIQQVGSDQSDHLAKGGGISVDNDGNAIVYAETSGSMFAEWRGDMEEHVEAVVFTMSKKDGSYADLYVPGIPPVASPVMDPSPVDDQADSMAALQTGPDVGPTYAGGMFYSPFTNSLYLTGATYGGFSVAGSQTTAADSSCFFGVVSLPKLEWIERDVYGDSAAPEACSALSVTSAGDATTAVVVGSTEDGGLLTGLGSNDAKQYGMVLDIASIDGRFELQGGALMDEEQVQYPVAVEAVDSTAWVVSMTARETTVNPDFTKTSTRERPNLTAGGIHKFGAKYRIAIDKYDIQRSESANVGGVLETSMRLQWRKPFETADQESVYVSDLITVRDGSVLVMVGSTKASKKAVDMDGIMAKIDTDEGTFVSGPSSGDRAVAYFSSVTGRDDWLLGACSDPDDPNAFYVVGATQGKMEQNADRSRNDVTVHAVVAKIHVDKLTAIWTKQFSVTHASGSDEQGAAASAYGCDVINGAGAMYVAGTVENGAVMDQGDQESAGRDDIFVAKLLTKDGNLAWMKQVGSNGDDRIAHGGGVKVDANGNAVVYGDTNGSFFRDRSSDGDSSDYSDLFMMIFNQADGSHRDPIQAGPTTKLPSDTSTPQEWYPNGVSLVGSTLKLISFAIIALAMFVIAAFCFCCGRHQARKRAERRKASVYLYLQGFDVQDIDLRRSPAGGWHGTYLHRLAYGINDAADGGGLQDVDDSSTSTYESTLLTHSSLVRDSLFMDTMSPPSLGVDSRDKPTDPLEYDNLVPRSYEDRSNSLKMKEII